MEKELRGRRRTLGYVNGTAGAFGRAPFYQIQLDKDQVGELDRLLAEGNAVGRCTVSITASFHQPSRLRLTEVDPPAYESRACATYMRGDAMRVQGREGVSCGMDLSAKWGVPALRNELRRACRRAERFVLLRVPSRKRDVVEIVPDLDLRSLEMADQDALAAASLAFAGAVLEVEDFSDWKN